MVEPFAQGLGEPDHARDETAHQDVHVEGNAGFELGEPEHRFHEDHRIDAARARLQHDTDVFRRFVAHVRQQRQLLLLQ